MIDENFFDHVAVGPVEKEMLTAKCLRCEQTWHPKIYGVVPKRCAKCNSPYWNVPRKKPGEPGAVSKYGFEVLADFKWHGFPWILKPDGSTDWKANNSRGNSLDQFCRRRGWVVEHKNGKADGLPALLLLRVK